MRNLILSVAAAAALTAPAAASPPAPPPAGEEARIPFADFGGIRDFHAVGDDVLYLQDRARNWYRARLFGPCFGLPWALRVGIDTRGSSSFDRNSAVLVDGERCRIESVTRSGPPPKKHPKRG
ncbi:MAG TPA: DUF6491 family protein [Allosphingosinicella sp.]|jgi:hypothetical protein